MFWWGNFFSVTLHLSGMHKEAYVKNVPEIYSFLQENGFFICVNQDEWQHHFEKTNYISLNKIESESIFQKPFFKLSKKLDLKDWEKAPAFFETSYAGFLQLLAPLNYPGGERVL